VAQQLTQLHDLAEVERSRLTIAAVALSGIAGEVYICKDCAGTQ
jgi:hypothetical protein